MTGHQRYEALKAFWFDVLLHERLPTTKLWTWFSGACPLCSSTRGAMFGAGLGMLVTQLVGFSALVAFALIVVAWTFAAAEARYEQ